MKKLVYITVDENNAIQCSWSNMTNIELVGLIEYGKQSIMDEFNEE